MSGRHTVIRSLHDVGLAAWFGGSLMGAVGLNGAAEHLFGGGGLLAVNAHRVKTQHGVGASTTAKTVVTAAALAATAYARVLGKKVEWAASANPDDTEKGDRHPIDLGKARRQLACVQWTVPALTGCLVVLNALHGEQQRPREQLHGMWEHARAMTPLIP
jgi:hypothetical protein